MYVYTYVHLYRNTYLCCMYVYIHTCMCVLFRWSTTVSPTLSLSGQGWSQWRRHTSVLNQTEAQWVCSMYTVYILYCTYSTCTYVHIRIRLYMYVYVFTCTYVCMYLCSYVCTFHKLFVAHVLLLSSHPNSVELCSTSAHSRVELK